MWTVQLSTELLDQLEPGTRCDAQRQNGRKHTLFFDTLCCCFLGGLCERCGGAARRVRTRLPRPPATQVRA